jgi:uncharacterized protein
MPMTSIFFNVATLLQENTGASRDYDIDEEIDVDGTSQRLVGHARLDRTPRGVLVRAGLEGESPGECSRCLRPVTIPIQLSIDEEFIPTIDIHTGARVVAPDGEDDLYRINGHHELDLGEAVLQYWAMAQPMAPLCRPDCAGLCPACGELAGSTHACEERPIDSRWSKLAELQDKLQR